MASSLYIVLADVPVGSEQADAWSDEYVARVLSNRAFSAVQRYELVQGLAGRGEVTFKTMLMAECNGDPVDAASHILASEDSSVRELSFTAEPIGDLVKEVGYEDREPPGGPQRREIIFSDAAADVPDDDFDTWYRAHLDEILTIPGFQAAQRYKPDSGIGQLGSVPTRRIAVYTVDRAAEDLHAEMDRMNLLTADSYVKFKETDTVGPRLPSWWESVRFAGVDCVAVGEPLVAATPTGR